MRLDRYVVRACEAAKTDDPAHEQRVVYLSVRIRMPFVFVFSRIDCPRASSPPERTRPRPFSTQSKSPHSSRAVSESLTHALHRSKGLTERALAHLGYADTIVFRPGYLRGAERPEKRIGESIVAYVVSSRLVLWVC